jgi:hypothetical protein
MNIFYKFTFQNSPNLIVRVMVYFQQDTEAGSIIGRICPASYLALGEFILYML